MGVEERSVTMGVREKLGGKSKVATVGAVAALVVVGTIFAVTRVRQEVPAGPGQLRHQAFFTTDDGASWFADEESKRAPFKTADGKTAVKAHVFQCSHGKTFVGYLERYKDAAPPAAPAAAPAGGNGSGKGRYEPYAGSGHSAAGNAIQRFDLVEVKPPQKGQWVSMSNTSAAGEIINPNCPEGDGQVREIMP